MNWLVKPLVSAVALVASSLGFSLDHRALHDAVSTATTPREVQSILKRFDVMNNGDPDLAQLASQIAYKPLPSSREIDSLRNALEIRALAGGDPPATKSLDKLSDLKNSPLYHDPGVQHESNWLQKSLQSLGEWIRNLFNFDRPRVNETSAGPVLALPEFITFLIWAVVVAAAALAVFFIARVVASNRVKSNRKKALISEEEIGLSADEWLRRADILIASGDYREAVRCLYVASLMKLDHSGILEFRRHETNWEHLSRYHDIPRKPEFNLTTPTREFDLIWYGHRLRGLEDAERFRDYYQDLLGVLKRGRPAA